MKTFLLILEDNFFKRNCNRKALKSVKICLAFLRLLILRSKGQLQRRFLELQPKTRGRGLYLLSSTLAGINGPGTRSGDCWASFAALVWACITSRVSLTNDHSALLIRFEFIYTCTVDISVKVNSQCLNQL